MPVICWPCHDRNIERRVQQVTETCGKMFAREEWISQEISKQFKSQNESKQNVINLTNFNVYSMRLKNIKTTFLQLIA